MSKVQDFHIRELDVDIIPPSTSRMNDPEQGGSKITVIGKPGCFAKGTKVFLWDKTIKNIEDIKVGDKLIGDDDKERNVLSLCYGLELMYKIKTNDKITRLIVNKSHILSLSDSNGNIHDMTLSFYLSNEEEFSGKYFWARKKGSDILKSAFTIKPLEIGEYYGVIIDGNRRFLLSDYSIVHNTGKCLGEGTPVMMSSGEIRAVEEINEGDLLMGDDGTPRTVLSTVSGMDDMFEIIQDNGDNFIANSPHLLSLKTINHSSIPDGKIFHITVDNYFHNYDSYSQIYYGYKVGIDFPDKEIKDIDFYEAGKKLTNFIPRDYLINSRDKRLSLLAGILEDDSFFFDEIGIVYLSEDGGIIDDLLFLIRSLGLLVNQIIPDGIIQRYHKVCIFGKISDIPFQKRKVKDVIKEPCHNHLAYRIKLRYIGKERYYGFQLDGNKRFLLGDFTVTHNTTLISSLIYEKSHIFPVGMAMSGTEDSNHQYSKIFPSTFVYNKLDEDAIVNFIKRQKIAKQHLPNPWSLILIDDCADDPQIFRKPLFQKVYKNGRHFKSLLIMSLQYPGDIGPTIRTNVDGTFILREPNLTIRKKIWENYASIIPTFPMFCSILDSVCQDFTALYIANNLSTNNIEDCVFYYKAKPVPEDFKFGCPEYWDFHHQRYNTEYVDPVIV